MTSGVLAILGSGETAPGMTKVHRELFKRHGRDFRAVTLDSAYGFQENVPEMTEKLQRYFDTSLHVSVEALHFPSFEQATEVERAIFKQEVREADYVFAGPGSPSYAIAQWLPLKLGSDLLSVLDGGGTLCFSSAAAATLGTFSPPIYEIYKVGSSLYWNDGLNLLSEFGLSCVVIPHFNNNEGANYDTSCCYLGLRRLELMEALLPEAVATLGVDEHTAVVLNREADTLRVLGRSNAYWRHQGEVRTLANGSTTRLDEFRTMKVSKRQSKSEVSLPISPSNELAEKVLRGGADGLEALALLVRRSNSGAEGSIDPKPLVDGVVAARNSARSTGQFALADELRNALLSVGIEIHDGPDGTSWSLK